MPHLSKKFISLLLIFSLVSGGMHGSNGNTTPSAKYKKECLLSSFAIGTITGLLSSAIYRKSTANCVPEFPWMFLLGSGLFANMIVNALHYERGSDDDTKEVAHEIVTASVTVPLLLAYASAS